MTDQSTGGTTGGRQPRVLVYGDVDLNLLDGSAIWVQSAAQVFAGAGAAVDVLLKAPVKTDRLVAPIAATAGVRVVKAPEVSGVEGVKPAENLTPKLAVAVMAKLDKDARYDVVIARGLRLVRAIVEDGTFAGRLWTYLTDVPQSAVEMTAKDVADLDRIATASRFVLCQTEDLRGHLETFVPAAAHRCVLFPPVVPELEGLHREERPVGTPAKLVYSGKYAPRWRTLEMAALPAQLGERGVAAELHMIGDKVHDDPLDPLWSHRMRSALTGGGVINHGGLPRAESLRLSAACDIGLGWRDIDLDSSLELSTKVLEFGALGLPAVINRNPLHERMLGVDYPLFVDELTDVVDACVVAATDPDAYAVARERLRTASAGYLIGAAVERVRGYLAEVVPAPAPALASARPGPLKVCVASHDLKFFGFLLDHLRVLPGVEVRVDAWEALSKHDEAASKELRDWADVVVCEWAGPNLAWYSRNKRPGQRLITRLHRFELDGPWMKQIKIEAVDQVICVSPHYADETVRRLGWPREKIGVIANGVDVGAYRRVKVPGAEFRLGMIGISPLRKRPDLALDVLDLLRREDPRFQLFMKSKMSWDYWWIWRREPERSYVEAMLRRVQEQPTLRGAVTVDGFGGDVGSWLRKIGFLLSTSDDESFHLAPAEGMASGAVPLLLPWPGSQTIYDPHWIVPTPEQMAQRILETALGGRFDAEAERAQREVATCFDLPVVRGQWQSVLVENLDPALTPASFAQALVPA